MYRLKAGVESFQVVDGPFAYKTFKKGEVYDAVPPGEADKFEDVGAGSEPARTEPAPAGQAEAKRKTKPASAPPASWLDDEKGGNE